MAPRASPATTASAASDRQNTLPDELSLPIILSDRVLKSVQEVESSQQECSDLARQVDRLSHMLRSLVRLAVTTPCFYEPPVRRIVSDVSKNLDRALTLVRKCKHSGVLRQVFAITTTADFRKVSSLLESSIGDMKWLLSIFDCDGVNLSLPNIGTNDPIFAWVWSSIATIQMGQLKDRIDAANHLASLALDNDRNKGIIVGEGGISPLLKMLKDAASPDAQIAASTALFNIATDQERIRLIVDSLGIPIIVHALSDSPLRVKIFMANLISRMAENNHATREEFARENVTKPLVSLLSMDTVLDDPVTLQLGQKTSFHSLVQINKALAGKNSSSHLSSSYSSSSLNLHRKEKKEAELETLEMKVKVKTSCAEALWKLSTGCVSNSRKITETKGLLCLAKIIEKESGILQRHCLMTVMEVAACAESNPDLRRSAFKTNSAAAKAILDQLLRVIQEESTKNLQILAIRSIGYLARTFPAKETRVVSPLVSQLGNKNIEVAIEAAIALNKFVCSGNFNRVDHSKAIIEFNGVPLLMILIKGSSNSNSSCIINHRAQKHGLVLLCNLALHVANSKALEHIRALAVIEGMARLVVSQAPELEDLFTEAIHNLTLYQAGASPQHSSVNQSYSP